MSSNSQGSVKGEAATVAPPSGSASSHGPPLSPSTTSKSPELPDELVQAGWSKCWSRRENRPYYFNRFTNQSLWEVPVLGQHDVIVSSLFAPVVHRLVTLSHVAMPQVPCPVFFPSILVLGWLVNKNRYTVLVKRFRTPFSLQLFKL
ncbi:hypothetical protein ILYODFUR_033452 [Ilyodon furcidens]|uniref:WW domain-containing protein n=1 Tax=Ilyodon furcidens TaxID=33524 RepID=A0ABV0UXC2_9TELE